MDPDEVIDHHDRAQAPEYPSVRDTLVRAGTGMYEPAEDTDMETVKRDMEYARSARDYNEVGQGKRFFDSGTRIPGAQKARNDAYEERLKRR